MSMVRALAQTKPLARRWSPPSSPDPDHVPVISVNDRGMITDSTQSPSPAKSDAVNPTKRKRRTLQYVSRHFAQPKDVVKAGNGGHKRKRRKVEDESDILKEPGVEEKNAVVVASDSLAQSTLEDDQTGAGRKKKAPLKAGSKKRSRRVAKSEATAIEEESVQVTKTNGTVVEDDKLKPPHREPWQQVLAAPPEKQQETFARIYYGLNVDELSSDSDLTDVPDDIGPDPFATPTKIRPRSKTKKSARNKTAASKVVAVKEETTKIKAKPKSGLTKSPYFPHAHKPRPTFLSTLPFPPLHLERFGLMQERLCHDPFRLLLATIFLNKTPGSRAMPVFYKLMEQYPTPQDLAAAEQPDVTAIIQQLGFQNQRARKCIAMAKRWVEDPPVKGRRWRKSDYPRKGDGKDIKAEEVVSDEDGRVAWEISHLPGLGPYSHDSWRMFCRDELRGLAEAYNGNGACKDDLEPEWKRVLPMDKELRAWMTWMWMKEGWIWNKETGEKTKASDELMELARGKGNMVLESESNTLHVKSLDEDRPSTMKLPVQEKKDVRVEAPAGDFLPESDGNLGSGQVNSGVG